MQINTHTTNARHRDTNRRIVENLDSNAMLNKHSSIQFDWIAADSCYMLSCAVQ